ncbi:hypothetical protein, partial [Undibacterium oligocarboniphilum]|uniref:hypothetical protein n=1 Tax=Undibacterium oligocarboniphilum TaxID=666702 RepID=UPI001C40B35A
MYQLELFPFQVLTVAEKTQIFENIRGYYWYIRNARKTSIHDARRRKFYRLVAVEKKRLRLSGVPKDEILEFLSCCRLKCGRVKQCQFCKGEFRSIYARIQ